MHSLGRPSLAALLVVSVLGAWSGATMLEDMVAKVNGKPLLLSEYRKNLRSVLDTYQRGMPGLLKDKAAVTEIRRKVLDQMVDDELLAQEADKLKLKVYARELDKGVEEVQERNFRVDEATGKRRTESEMAAALQQELQKEGLSDDRFRERIRKQLLMRKVVEDQVRSKIKEPDDKRARDAFEKLKAVVVEGTAAVKGLPPEEAQFYADFGSRLRDTHSERVRVSHILVKVPAGAPLVEKTKALEKANALKKRLEAGEDFADVAQKESEDAESAPRGGDLGFVLRGWMPAEFEKAAFSTEVGRIGGPIETNFGYHVILVQEKKARENLSFDKLKPDIKQFLMGLDMQKELQVYVKRLRSGSTIEEKVPADD